MSLGVCAGGDTGSSGSADKMCCRELILATRLPVAGDWIGVGAGGRVRRLWADARVDHVPGRRLAWLSLVSTKVGVGEWEMGCARVGLGYSVLSCEGVGEELELRAKACDDGLGESRARAVEARRFVSS